MNTDKSSKNIEVIYMINEYEYKKYYEHVDYVEREGLKLITTLREIATEEHWPDIVHKSVRKLGLWAYRKGLLTEEEKNLLMYEWPKYFSWKEP